MHELFDSNFVQKSNSEIHVENNFESEIEMHQELDTEVLNNEPSLIQGQCYNATKLGFFISNTLKCSK
jgi:hypothetical protein